MSTIICTWNINSVRLREPLVLKLLKEEQPDVLCLQECKALVDLIPTQNFADLGYKYMVARGQKGYNGVAILSRVPMKDIGHRQFVGKPDARHVAAELENGMIIHNFYIPAGGDIPDIEKNDKFDHKLKFLTEMHDWFIKEPPQKSVLVGDLNIAPLEDDVWNHKQLLKVVSHTPIECEYLAKVQKSADWVDITRKDIPDGKLYTWWSYRAKDWDATNKGRRLDHIWATPDIAKLSHSSRVHRQARGWTRPSDHAPLFATFDL